MNPIIQCGNCEGLGLVRYYTLMQGAQATTLSVARECPVCEGKGMLTPGPLVLLKPQRLNTAPTRAARPVTEPARKPRAQPMPMPPSPPMLKSAAPVPPPQKKAPRWPESGATVVADTPTMPKKEVITCEQGGSFHRAWYIGVDEYIERMVPGFFESHQHTKLGEEWHVCMSCGFAKGPFAVSLLSVPFRAALTPRVHEYSHPDTDLASR